MLRQVIGRASVWVLRQIGGWRWYTFRFDNWVHIMESFKLNKVKNNLTEDMMTCP